MRLTKVKLLEHIKAHVAIVFDEVKVKEWIVYDKHCCLLLGFVNMGDINNQLLWFDRSIDDTNDTRETVAKQVLVFMVRGLFESVYFLNTLLEEFLVINYILWFGKLWSTWNVVAYKFMHWPVTRHHLTAKFFSDCTKPTQGTWPTRRYTRISNGFILFRCSAPDQNCTKMLHQIHLLTTIELYG